MPASRSTLRWCETVGWERSKSGTSSQTQTLPACLHHLQRLRDWSLADFYRTLEPGLILWPI